MDHLPALGEPPATEVVTAPESAQALPPALAELAFVRGLWRLAGARATDGNRVGLLVDGPRAFGDMIGAIEDARTEVLLESYIFADDHTGRRFADALLAAAGRGVDVLVIADWVGSMETPRRFWTRLRKGGVEVRVFQRPGPRRWLGLVPRDHRKLLVVDRRIGFTGGFGLADAWSTGDADMGEAGGGRWRDTGIRIEGPAVADMRAAFGRMWRRANRRNTFEDLGYNEQLEEADGAVVGIVEGLPLRLRSERAFHYHTAVAGRSIWIANAYFTPARPQIEALCLAARDGVDVRILVPSRYDHPWVRRFTRAAYRRLRGSGVRIWEWQGSMMHAKTHVVDGIWVRVGSTDLNPLGVIVNYELDATVCDERLGSEASELFLRDLHRSREIT